ncbi:MAG: hypothetical protein ACFB10_15565 [Salibacteraceae bacterium]
MDNIEQYTQQLFQRAREQAPVTTSDDIFGTFLQSIQPGGLASGFSLFNLKTLIIMFSTSALLLTAILWGSSASEAIPTASYKVLPPVTTSTYSWQMEVDSLPTLSTEEKVRAPLDTSTDEQTTDGTDTEQIEVKQLAVHRSSEGGQGDGLESVKLETSDVIPEIEWEPIALDPDSEPQLPDTTLEEEEETIEITISYVITHKTTFEELEAIAKAAHQAGLTMRYDLKIKKGEIKKMELMIGYAGESRCYNTSRIVTTGTLIRTIGWIVDGSGHATEILK